MRRFLPLFTLLSITIVPGQALAHESEPVNAHSSQEAAVPLGDGKFQTTEAKNGYIYSCTQVGGGGGAFQDGPWIKSDGTWVPSEKIAVQGSVLWTQATFNSKLSGGKLLLSGNGLPLGSSTGIFPIASTDPAYNYDRNPNSISAQSLKYSLPASPKKASKPSCLPMGAIGVMNNGVQLFNGLDGQGKDAPAHEIQDSCQGHPEKTGAYHYHSMPSCISDSGSGHSKRLGYALDGFGIYGPRGIDGKPITNQQLDVCHGHTHKIIINGKAKNIYHYHLTSQYPYSLGCFRGTPVKSNSNKQQPGGQQPGSPPPPGGPPSP